mgnify:CR=1 FL=1
MKWIQVLVLVGLVSLTNGCGSEAPKTETPVAAAAVKETNPNNDAAIEAAKANPLEGIVGAYQKAYEAKSYRAQLVSTREDISGITKCEFVAPDRYRLSTGPTEIIAVGDATFLKTLGSWQRVADGLPNQLKSVRDTQMVEKMRAANNVKFVQADTLNGEAMLVYECTTSNLLGTEGITYAKTWVSIAEGLPRKAEFEGMIGSVKTRGVMTWFDYNADIKIEPPIK